MVPDTYYALIRRGYVVHVHHDRSVFEKWLKRDPWLYPPDECEIIPYRRALSEEENG